MASRTGITWDSVVKAGTDMMEVAGASLQRTMKIQEVTSSKDNDSQPAYALNELVQTCNKNSDDARAIAAALLRRASSTNPVVKWKALRAIRYICQNANTTQFKKACGGPSASVIREAISWSGPPHPQLGNALNLRVREAAKETLDEVFRVGAASSAGAMSGAGSSLQGRIQGYGSTTGGKIQSAGPPGGGGSGTGGFSNTGTSTGTGGKKYGGISSDDYFAGSTHGQWSTWSDASQSVLGPRGSASTESSPPPRGAPGTIAGTSAARAAIGSEESVVAELCRGSGGVQPRPTPEALRAFVAKASQLDAEVVALELTHKLFNTPWQERVRALDGMHAVLEAVKSRGGGHPLQATTESLCSVTEAFAGVLGHENAAVRAAAGRVMRALGVESTVSAAVAAAPATGVAGGGAAARTAPGGDLLGGFDEPAAAPLPPAAAAAAAAPAGPAMEDLLGGLDDGLGTATAGASVAQQGGLDMLAGLDRLEGAGTGAPAAPAAPPAVTDMFAGLTVSAGGAGAAAPTPAAAAPAPPAADQLDFLLGGLDDAPALAPAAPTLNGHSDAAAAGAVHAPALANDPLAGLGDLDFSAVMSAQPPAPPSKAPPSAGVVPSAAADSGLHGMHAMPNGTQAPAGMAQLGLQPGMAPPGIFGAAPAPAALLGGMPAAAGYGGPGMQGVQGMRGMQGMHGMQGMQPGYGMQAAVGGWNGQAGGTSGQQMHGIPAAAHAPGAAGGGAAAGGGMGLPQGSVGAPVAQHAFAHAAGSLGGHKDAFDFVNDVMKK